MTSAEAQRIFDAASDDEYFDWLSTFDDDAWECELCGGDGVREYNDAPDEWGEDCPSQRNHLIPCRGCAEVHEAKIMAFAKWKAGIKTPPG